MPSPRRVRPESDLAKEQKFVAQMLMQELTKMESTAEAEFEAAAAAAVPLVDEECRTRGVSCACY